MKTIPLQTRELLRQEVILKGQASVIQNIPQFQNPEIQNHFTPPNGSKSELKTIAFNMERGVNLQETLEFLTYCPDLSDADIILGNELDDGNVRSGQKNVAMEIANRLGMNYVFGVEFIELADPNNTKGFHGNAIFSRWPILRAKTFYPDEEYNWYHSEQPRIGARVAILAELDLNGAKLGVVTAHLENRASPKDRRHQMNQILKQIQEFFPANLPVLLGGDFNTLTYTDTDQSFAGLNKADIDAISAADVMTNEPLLQDIDRNGFHVSECNKIDAPTCRVFYEGHLENIKTRLDWLSARRLSPLSYGTVSTQIKNCDWAPENSKLLRLNKPEISDHDAIWLKTSSPTAG